jgi:cyanophycin synthetase
MIDYGHNPEAYSSICRMVANWQDRRITGIIGVPGDRADQIIEQTGRVVASGFNRIIVKEDRDLRGRKKGEVAKLLYNSIKDEVPSRDCRIVLDEREALSTAISEMEEGEIIMIFYEKLEPILDLLKELNAVRATMLEDTRKQSLARGS